MRFTETPLSRRRILATLGLATAGTVADAATRRIAVAQDNVVSGSAGATSVTVPGPLTSPAPLAPTGETGDPRVLNALTVAVRDVNVCASEQGGILMELSVKEGDEVEQDTVIARLDDRVLQKAKDVADTRVRAAEAEADKDISERYAWASAETAYADYISGFEANREAANAVSEYDIRQYKLKYQESKFQVEQVRYERRIAVTKRDVAIAEASSAAVELELSRMRAPVTGIVIRKFCERGEWLRPGDPIVQMLQQDQFYVQGFASAAVFEPQQLLGKPVKVEIPLARGRVIAVDGTVTIADPAVRTGGIFRVCATIPNMKENGVWVLRPGVWTKMTILTGEVR
ncbi:MAG: biotin/lipoyl-binding protein [Planctomycetia bacterium]|nr:biotin/lipoyl-binding protein [Planctomycetia bacterium]